MATGGFCGGYFGNRTRGQGFIAKFSNFYAHVDKQNDYVYVKYILAGIKLKILEQSVPLKKIFKTLLKPIIFFLAQ